MKQNFAILISMSFFVFRVMCKQDEQLLYSNEELFYGLDAGTPLTEFYGLDADTPYERVVNLWTTTQ